MTKRHRLLERQICKSRNASGEIDLDSLLDAISRSYGEDEEDSRRTDRSIQLMVDEIETAGHQLTHASEQLKITLNGVHHGILMVNKSGTVGVCNRRASEFLGLPGEFGDREFSLPELTSHLQRAEVCDVEDESTITVIMPGGRMLEIHTEPTGHGGCVILIEDVTRDRERERALRQAEAEYRSLFENSVYGIYRDTLEGKPLRLNRALAQIYGYSTEEECLAAIKINPLPGYVDPQSFNLFMDTLERDGKVTDFISQVRLHETGEPRWLIENAWYVRDDNGVPLYVEGTMLDATDRINAEMALQRHANYDSLTGAKSRHRFLQRMEEEQAKTGQGFVLYCIDLDMFKDINDVFGHAVGDEVLRAVVQRLGTICGGREGVARLGGDEFAVICGKPCATSNPTLMADEIISAMRAPFVIDGQMHHIGASVGIAVFPDHGSDSAELLRNADTALYEAKAAGRSGWRLFDQKLRLALEKRKAIERNLRNALHNKELSLHYQAVHDLKTGKVAGFEALMRWNSAELGVVSPSAFIPVAEQAGLMAELGAWAISQACEDAAIFGDNVHVSVNLSASQFRSSGLLPLIESELKRHNVRPGRLIVEITETVLVSNQAAAHDLLTSLDKLGVKIAIDDFGTGYSSLSYLQRMPISIVKIDRSFIVGMGERANAAVVRAVMGIGHDLGISIVAEGVENEAQLDALRKHGCRYIQGFLFSRPVPLTEAVADLAVSQLGVQAGRDSAKDRLTTLPVDDGGSRKDVQALLEIGIERRRRRQIDAAILDEHVAVGKVGGQPLVDLVACANRQPYAVIVGQAGRAGGIGNRRKFVSRAAAQGQPLVQGILSPGREVPAIFPVLRR